MKIKKLLVALSFVVLFAASFGAGQVFATTGCFTDSVGHWAETFICFLKDNSITSGFPDGTYKPDNGVTRAEMAVFLQKSIELTKSYADSLVNTPPSSGDILISTGFSDWKSFDSTDPIEYTNYSSYTRVKSSAIGTYGFVNQPAVPVTIYGKSLEFLGVEICYDADNITLLSDVQVRTYSQATALLSSSTLQLTDSTDRSDEACRYYVLDTPVLMTSDMGVEVYVGVEWTMVADNTSFRFGRTTYAFRPTGTNSSPLSMPPPSNVQEPAGPDTSPEVQP